MSTEGNVSCRCISISTVVEVLIENTFNLLRQFLSLEVIKKTNKTNFDQGGGEKINLNI